MKWPDADLRPGAAPPLVAGNTSEETALEVASSAHDFKLMLAAQDQRASGIEQVIGDDEAPEDSLQFVKR